MVRSIHLYKGANVSRASVRDMLDRMTKQSGGDEGSWSPAVDIYETPSEVVLVADLAGVGRDEVQVILDGEVVRIYGQRQPSCCSKGARFHRMEIPSGYFVRSFRITVPYVADHVAAHYEDGLLVVTLPKRRLPEGA